MRTATNKNGSFYGRCAQNFSRVPPINNTYIISDLHIGLPHFQQQLFREFMAHLPDSSRLVLNGDTIDDPTRQLSAEQQQALDLLTANSRRLRIVWVEGNHDSGFRLQEPGNIAFVKYHIIPELSVYIAHGEHFDNVMPYNRWFIKLFRSIHKLRIMLGASPVHVAEYAKKWPLLYDYLRNNVATNAFEHARENGWDNVACGHIHFPEVRQQDTCTYWNTGTWTENPPHYLFGSAGKFELREYHGGCPAGGAI
ncbi:MAG: metallophosphoesterase family protein [Lentisphaeria bacterium]